MRGQVFMERSTLAPIRLIILLEHGHAISTLCFHGTGKLICNKQERTERWKIKHFGYLNTHLSNGKTEKLGLGFEPTYLFLCMRVRRLRLDFSLGLLLLLLLLLLLQTLTVHWDPAVTVQLLSFRRHHLVVCSSTVISCLLVLFAAIPPVEK